jgi:hypothetical protein
MLIEQHTMISHATKIGRSHRLMQQNCHDFAITGTLAPDCAFGLVLDGCGSKYRHESGTIPSHNEVGAKLLGQFTADYLTTHLPHNDLSPTFFEQLYTACSNFLRGLLALFPTADQPAQNRFIATHLLCTIVGFVIKRETAVFFWSGDGYLCQNAKVTYLDNNNSPDYLAYQVSGSTEEQQYKGDGRFHTQTLPGEDIYRLAVATDGWTADLLANLEAPQSTLALQRWLNIQAKARGNFADDGAIAIWWNQSR